MVFSTQMVITIAIIFSTIAFLIHGKIRKDLIALCSLVAFMLTGILTPTEAFSGFSNSVIFIMASMFIISGAIVRSGLARIMSQTIVGFARGNEKVLFMLTMVVTALIGSLVSNTGTVAIMMPIVVSMAMTMNTSPSRYLMPLAFMSAIGGMLTLVGNPTNMVINDVYIKAGYESLKFFSFTPVGIVCMIIGVLVVAPVTEFFLFRRKDTSKKDKKTNSLEELIDKYELSKNMYEILIPNNSLAQDISIQELDTTGQYGVVVQKIMRRNKGFAKTKEDIIPTPSTKVMSGDVLSVLGARSSIEKLVKDFGYSLLGTPSVSSTSFQSIGVAELVVMSASRLVGATVAKAELREQFGVIALGIRRGDKHLLENVKDEVIHSGDALLIQGSTEDFSRLNNASQNWVIINRTPGAVQDINTQKLPHVAIILAVMLIAMATNVLPTVLIALMAAIALVLVKCFKNLTEAYSFINWETMIMIACLLPLSIAMEKTGLVDIIANYLSTLGIKYGAHAALAIIYAITSMLNIILSSTPLALLVTPVAIKIAIELGCNPLTFVFAVATAANLCFASSFSTPSNALVVSTGGYTFLDYIKIGLPLQIFVGVVMIIMLPIIIPF